MYGYVLVVQRNKIMSVYELTKEERSAIRKLKCLAKTWPKSIWIKMRENKLDIMLVDPTNNEQIDNEEYILETIDFPARVEGG